METTAVEDMAVRSAPLRWRRWPAWAGPLAGAWSLAYGGLGLFWAFGGVGFPFGREGDADADLTWFPGARPDAGGPLIAVLGVAAAAAALAMTARWGRRVPRRVLLAVAWGIAAALLLLVPDYRVLVAVAYAPIFLIGAPFGWPPASFAEAIPWPVIHQFLCIGGALLWATAAEAYRRRSRGTPGRDGQRGGDAGWTSPAAVARWGRWAVAVAVVVPCLYATTRWAWALGIPLGISDEFLREGEAEGMWWAGAALASVAVGGAILTLGLVQRWGEMFPRWIPILAGRRVPPALAIVPASVVSVLVTVAGLMFVRLTLTGFWAGEGENWAAIAPELLWPIWGVALALATFAYAQRRVKAPPTVIGDGSRRSGASRRRSGPRPRSW